MRCFLVLLVCLSLFSPAAARPRVPSHGDLARAASDAVAKDPARLEAAIRAMPKVELHRHLEGAIRPETFLAVAAKHGITLPATTVEGLTPLVSMTANDHTLADFLAKFKVISQIWVSLEVMEEIAKQCVIDAHRENIVALELRFAPNSMARLKNLDPNKVVEAVVRGVQAGERETGVVVSLVVIISRYLPPEVGMQIEQLAHAHMNTGATSKSARRPSFGRVIGLDLAADEARFPAPPFAPCFQAAERDGLRRTVHAGEALGPESVLAALDLCRAERIGHGVRSFADPALVERLVKNGVVLEMCPTSNVQTGAVASLAEHPLKRFLALGGKATINTDDPGVCATDLNREFLIAARDLGLSLADLETCVLNAGDAMFLPPALRGAVRASLRRRMDALNRELSTTK